MRLNPCFYGCSLPLKAKYLGRRTLTWEFLFRSNNIYCVCTLLLYKIFNGQAPMRRIEVPLMYSRTMTLWWRHMLKCPKGSFCTIHQSTSRSIYLGCAWWEVRVDMIEWSEQKVGQERCTTCTFRTPSVQKRGL